ncbi:MAG: hypothetical protein WA960_06080 [Tunicatimonas sp.]
MLTKEKVLQTVRQLPDKFSLDELLDEMVLLQKIERGLAQSDNDEVISDDELDKQLSEWLS